MSGKTALSTESELQGKAERLFRHCVYRIATGKWGEGERLPGIRETMQRWSASQLTVQAAYGRLVQAGLADRRPRSGYYVAGGGILDRISRNRHVLDRLHGRVEELVREAGLSTLGVLRYLEKAEEVLRQDRPEVAFVECTEAQARGHAEEIAQRLRVPTMPLTTREIGGSRAHVPPSVRCLLTSPFHLEELRRLHEPPELTVTAVPIEVSPEVMGDLETGPGELLLLEIEESMASHLAEDVSRLLDGAELRVSVVDDPVAEVERALVATTVDECPPWVLLSPRIWGSIAPANRRDPRIRPVAFRISDSAWPRVAEAVGLPVALGA